MKSNAQDFLRQQQQQVGATNQFAEQQARESSCKLLPPPPPPPPPSSKLIEFKLNSLQVTSSNSKHNVDHKWQLISNSRRQISSSERHDVRKCSSAKLSLQEAAKKDAMTSKSDDGQCESKGNKEEEEDEGEEEAEDDDDDEDKKEKKEKKEEDGHNSEQQQLINVENIHKFTKKKNKKRARKSKSKPLKRIRPLLATTIDHQQDQLAAASRVSTLKLPFCLRNSHAFANRLVAIMLTASFVLIGALAITCYALADTTTATTTTTTTACASSRVNLAAQTGGAGQLVQRVWPADSIASTARTRSSQLVELVGKSRDKLNKSQGEIVDESENEQLASANQERRTTTTTSSSRGSLKLDQSATYVPNYRHNLQRHLSSSSSSSSWSSSSSSLAQQTPSRAGAEAEAGRARAQLEPIKRHDGQDKVVAFARPKSIALHPGWPGADQSRRSAELGGDIQATGRTRRAAPFSLQSQSGAHQHQQQQQQRWHTSSARSKTSSHSTGSLLGAPPSTSGSNNQKTGVQANNRQQQQQQNGLGVGAVGSLNQGVQANDWQQQQVAPSRGIKNVTAQNGQSVTLHCLVDQNESGEIPSVSWFRGTGELQLLTFETTAIIQDERFVVHHGIARENDWALQIKNLNKSTDSGLYQCQTSGDNSPQLQSYQLNIVEPQVSILGSPDLAVKLGAPINLTCAISQSPDQLQFVFWYRDSRMINYDISQEKRGKIVMSKLLSKPDTITSNLQIFQSKSSDSGNYTCTPSGAMSTSIYVHVLEASDKRLIMFQNDDNHLFAASSQQTNSAISSQIALLTNGRAYAIFVAFFIFATWFQLIAQLQTAISLSLLAIIGLFLSNSTSSIEPKRGANDDNDGHYDDDTRRRRCKFALTSEHVGKQQPFEQRKFELLDNSYAEVPASECRQLTGDKCSDLELQIERRELDIDKFAPLRRQAPAGKNAKRRASANKLDNEQHDGDQCERNSLLLGASEPLNLLKTLNRSAPSSNCSPSESIELIEQEHDNDDDDRDCKSVDSFEAKTPLSGLKLKQLTVTNGSGLTTTTRQASSSASDLTGRSLSTRREAIIPTTATATTTTTTTKASKTIVCKQIAHQAPQTSPSGSSSASTGYNSDTRTNCSAPSRNVNLILEQENCNDERLDNLSNQLNLNGGSASLATTGRLNCSGKTIRTISSGGLNEQRDDDDDDVDDDADDDNDTDEPRRDFGQDGELEMIELLRNQPSAMRLIIDQLRCSSSGQFGDRIELGPRGVGPLQVSRIADCNSLDRLACNSSNKLLGRQQFGDSSKHDDTSTQLFGRHFNYRTISMPKGASGRDSDADSTQFFEPIYSIPGRQCKQSDTLLRPSSLANEPQIEEQHLLTKATTTAELAATALTGAIEASSGPTGAISERPD